jgi:histidine triad (HIT) family protein
MSDDCVFCKIIQGDFGTEFIAESENAVAFRDISPAAPTHILVAPRRHIIALRDLDDSALASELLELVRNVAKAEGLFDSGYRVVTNDGAQAGQSVWHLHFHVLGGKRMAALG